MSLNTRVAVKNKAAEAHHFNQRFHAGCCEICAIVGKLKHNSVKMLKLIGNLESRINRLEKELKELKQD